MVRTWALEMKKAGVTANAVIPVAATAMTKTVPYFQKAVEADERGEPMPAFFRHDLGFGTADDVAGLVAFLASDAPPASPARRSAPAATACSSGPTPRPPPPSTARAAGATRTSWRTSARSSADKLQSVGEDFLPLPDGPASPNRPRSAEMAAQRYEPGIDAAALDAIDMHVHLEVDGHGHESLPAALTEASAKYFKAEDRSPSLDRIAEVYRELNMAAVVFTVDARTQLKHEPNSIAELHRRAPPGTTTS